MEGVAIFEEKVELRSVTREVIGSFIEYPGEDRLHGLDLCADGNFPAEMFLQIGGGGQMVGMRVRFQQPVDRQAIVFDIGDDCHRRSEKPVRPDGWSKSHTLSIIAALCVPGSWTTVAGSEGRLVKKSASRPDGADSRVPARLPAPDRNRPALSMLHISGLFVKI